MVIVIFLINGTLKRRSEEKKKQGRHHWPFEQWADKEAREERSDRGGVKSVKPRWEKKKLDGLRARKVRAISAACNIYNNLFFHRVLNGFVRALRDGENRSYTPPCKFEISAKKGRKDEKDLGLQSSSHDLTAVK